MHGTKRETVDERGGGGTSKGKKKAHDVSVFVTHGIPEAVPQSPNAMKDPEIPRAIKVAATVRRNMIRLRLSVGGGGWNIVSSSPKTNPFDLG